MKDKWMKYLIKAVLFTMLLLTMPVGVSAAAKVEKVTYPKGTYIPDRFSEYPDIHLPCLSLPLNTTA